MMFLNANYYSQLIHGCQCIDARRCALRRAKQEGVPYAMSMREVMRQMPATAGRTLKPLAHAPATKLYARAMKRSAQGQRCWLVAVLTRENLQQACKRVRANKGTAGDVAAESGTTGNDSETGRWRAWHSDGDGSADPASAAARIAADSGPDFQRMQLWFPTGAQRTGSSSPCASLCSFGTPNRG